MYIVRTWCPVIAGDKAKREPDLQSALGRAARGRLPIERTPPFLSMCNNLSGQLD